MSSERYEFTEQENLVIKKLFSQMTFVGISLIALGALFGIFGIYLLITSQSVLKEIFVLVVALVILIMGIITLRSANSFRRVVKTEGDDLGHLVAGLDKLTTWFSIVTTIILISAGVLVLGFVAYLSI